MRGKQTPSRRVWRPMNETLTQDNEGKVPMPETFGGQVYGAEPDSICRSQPQAMRGAAEEAAVAAAEERFAPPPRAPPAIPPPPLMAPPPGPEVQEKAREIGW